MQVFIFYAKAFGICLVINRKITESMIIFVAWKNCSVSSLRVDSRERILESKRSSTGYHRAQDRHDKNMHQVSGKRNKKVSMDSGIIEKVGSTTLRDFFIGVDKKSQLFKRGSWVCRKDSDLNWEKWKFNEMLGDIQVKT